MTNATKYRIIQNFNGEGLVASKLNGKGETFYFSSGELEGTTQRATCGVMGLTDAQAVLAWPAFIALAKDLVKSGKLVHLRANRRALQDAIMLAADGGTRAIVRECKIKRGGLLRDEPLLPLDTAPAAEYKPAAALLDRASAMVAEAGQQVNLTPAAVLSAVKIVMTDDSLTGEQREGAVMHLLAQTTGDLLARTPESIAAFALTSAIDRVSKGGA